MNDLEFEAYARLLRQNGTDLSNLQRVPDPRNGHRWLHVWGAEADAQAFADELNKRTRDNSWVVVAVDAPASQGPLGPLDVLVGRQPNGWMFTLHPLSRQMVEAVFPTARGVPSAFIATGPQHDDRTTTGDLARLAEQVAIILAGARIDEARAKFGGFRVYDPVARKELVAERRLHEPQTCPLCE
jgi:hypothetical protein